MTVRFLQSVASDTGQFVNGQIVSLRRLPKAWQAWLRAGIIRIEPEDQTEVSTAPGEPEQAVAPARRKRGARRA